MKSIDITPILQLIILIISTLISRYFIPYLKSKMEESRMEHLLEWTEILVHSVEQTFIGSGLGKDKLKRVSENLKAFCEKNGYTFSDDEIHAAIECAVKTMNEQKLLSVDMTDGDCNDA